MFLNLAPKSIIKRCANLDLLLLFMLASDAHQVAVVVVVQPGKVKVILNWKRARIGSEVRRVLVWADAANWILAPALESRQTSSCISLQAPLTPTYLWLSLTSSSEAPGRNKPNETNNSLLFGLLSESSAWMVVEWIWRADLLLSRFPFRKKTGKSSRTGTSKGKKVEQGAKLDVWKRRRVNEQNEMRGGKKNTELN